MFEKFTYTLHRQTFIKMIVFQTPDKSIYIISCPEDEKIYKPLKKEGLMVHNAEIVLTGVLKQEINLTAYRL